MGIVWALACVFSHTKAARWTDRDVRKTFSIKPEGRWTSKAAPMCFLPIQSIHPPSLPYWEPSFHRAPLPSVQREQGPGSRQGSTPASTSATAGKRSWGAPCCVGVGSNPGGALHLHCPAIQHGKRGCPVLYLSVTAAQKVALYE